MIFYLKGEIVEKNKDSVVLDFKGVGFKVFVSDESLKRLKIKDQVKLFLDHFIKHNEKIEFYGFLTEKEMELFQFLTKIPGIGTKAALSLSSTGSLEELQQKLLKGDKQLIGNLKGVGKKKLQRILIELGAKISKIEKEKNIEPENKEVINALTALGFSKQDVLRALERIPEDIQGAEEKTKEVLKILGRNRRIS
jgi:Holliday junction DNA helicase RuvA